MSDMSMGTAPYFKARRRGLNRLSGLRALLVGTRRAILVRLLGMDIHPTAQISLSAKLDRTFPIGVHVGASSYVALEAMVLTHDRTRGMYVHTWIGQNCFIGARSILLPGIAVGDGSIVAAGAVVTRDVPPGCIVAGNPARVVREGISTGAYGRLAYADLRESQLAEAGLT